MEESRKLRPLFIARLLREKTDELHRITSTQLIDAIFNEFGTMPDRRTIYRDMETLRNELGMDIQEDRKGYYLASREFELNDLSLLAECVYAAKFISEKEATDLIDVLCDFCSVYQANELKASVLLCDRAKTERHGALKVLNTIRSAMVESDRYRPDQIQFTYITHSAEDVHKTIAKHDGKIYTVTPYKLIINADNYYLLAVNENREVRTYRVDRMRNVKVLPNPKERDRWAYREEPHKQWRDMEKNIDGYLRRTFSMFGGEATEVTMLFRNYLIDTVIDKFGVGFGATYRPEGEDSFMVTAKVEVSNQFFAWMCGFHNDAKIIAPKPVVKQMKAFVSDIFQNYVNKR